jgi:hypothetical protein
MRQAKWLMMAGLLAAATAAAQAHDEKAGPKDNIPPAGFVALFNGKDLANWQGAIDMKTRAALGSDKDKLAAAQKDADAKILPNWPVAHGIIVHNGKREKGVTNSLGTAKDYGNFELLVDWKIEKAGDSGIYLRGQPQVQIWDSDNLGPNLKADAGSGSGGLWNNPKTDPKYAKGQRPLKKADKPVGEWNTFRIVMIGDEVTIHLNGELIIDKAPLANYWEKGQPLPKKGPIELQHHGDKLWFKNIYIKELPD